ncbi:hypothetical protein H1R17_11025 [Flavobacterium sp. xlx-214]|uniref:hypothetical protein n=1 Tax=unclassified Flavobacterium TaxID=196869 RepID=UPI0013D6E6D4|nr:MULTISPECIES: hypothetical protein [unclassified Flavobacterium]MBA5791746.1 hypothetical protein [Flavobacterium sp. xlx-221]QMI82985.1 hypothetical protein H1R17_11025 [Flavobacterium sp. xlx-214]
MRSEICTCQGLNSNCKKCFGSGFISTETTNKSTNNGKGKKKQQLESFLPKNLDLLSKNEVEGIAIKIIGDLDLKSKKQMQILNSIPFNTTTFRRDFGDKFELLGLIEAEKQHLRNELLIIDQEIILKNYKSNFKFKHFLSDKDLDVTSNRQLKELIRAYKKLKNT